MCIQIGLRQKSNLSFSSINLLLYQATSYRRLANICVIFEMVRFSTPLASFFLSFSVTGKSFGDKERNDAHKGREVDERQSGDVRLWKTLRWIKLSVTRARLMHYAKVRIARFGVIVDRSTADRLPQSICWCYDVQKEFILDRVGQ